MKKKYKLIKESKTKHYRLVALKDFGLVKKGDKGGLVEGEHNLSHEGNCWIGYDAEVFGNAKVYGNATVSGDASISGHSHISGNAQVYGNAEIYGTAMIYDNANISGNAWIFGSARVYGNATVSGDASISGHSQISRNTSITETRQCINISSFKYNITVTPQIITIGCKSKTFEDWMKVTKDEAIKLGLSKKEYITFKQLLKPLYKYVC